MDPDMFCFSLSTMTLCHYAHKLSSSYLSIINLDSFILIVLRGLVCIYPQCFSALSLILSGITSVPTKLQIKTKKLQTSFVDKIDEISLFR